MFRNYLAAALRNLVRNRLYAAINIVGLAVGFAAALLIGLYVRNEFSFEKFIPGYSDIYHITLENRSPVSSPTQSDRLPPDFAELLKAETSSVEDITRLFLPAPGPQPILRKGEIESREELLWADPNVFRVLPLPSIAGDVQTALATPDGVVITRSLARKYFGRDNPVGERLELDRKYSLEVNAVIEDLPPETHMRFSALLSGLSSVSPQVAFRTSLAGNARYYDAAYTYFRLKPGTQMSALQAALRATAARPEVTSAPPLTRTFDIEPIALTHLRPGTADAMKPSSGRGPTITLATVALLIVVIAGINFVNLMTARATRRAIEVGIRKVEGAARRDLIIQFVGEAVIYSLAGTILAAGLGWLLLSPLNGLVERGIKMNVSALEGLCVGMTVLVFSIIAGFYPAFVLSAFNPRRVLWSGQQKAPGAGWLQQILVSLQFAVLIGLTLAGGIIWRQTAFGMKEGLRINTDAVLIVGAGGCTPAFEQAVLQLPGVHGAACSLGAPLEWFRGVKASRPGGTDIIISAPAIDFGLLELYGLQPLAGRFFDAHYAADTIPADEQLPFTPHLVINERAVRDLGFSSPDAAIGQTINWGQSGELAEIIGVAPDFRLATEAARDAAPPISFTINPDQIQRFGSQNQLDIKLAGHDLPETLEAIDSLWKSLGSPHPISRFFVEAKVQETYVGIVNQARVFGLFSAIALLVACLGLFGLSAFSAERRTKEIGIRKAMGANTADVLSLLLWQFIKPVLWASAIAWPVAYFIMHHWLEEFAYHIDLSPWMFFAASALTAVIAVTTVIGHALLVARAQPVTALRYE